MAKDSDRVERRAALAALLSAALMIAQQVGSKATRDALFLGSFQPEDLPRVVIASAAASMVAVLAATRAYARWGPLRTVPVAFGVSAVLYLVEWTLYEAAPRPVAVALYLHTAVFGALVISGFWSVVNERFDPHTAKRVISRIGTGSTAGGVVGGLLAERIGEWGSASTMLVALAVLSAAAGIFVIRIGRGPGARVREKPETTSAFDALRKTPYLAAMAWLVVLTAVSGALLDYAFKAEAAATFAHGSEDLLRFFALFHVGAAIVSFVLQSALARPSLERLGVAGSVATLPLLVLATSAVAAGFARLWTVVIARATEIVLANSLFRSGYELLYTPVAPETKRPTKALIDVAGNRAGDALGSAMVLLVLALVPEAWALSVVLGLSALVALVTLIVARNLHRGYVGQLEERLRAGAPPKDEQEMLKAATLQTLSTLGLDREALFAELAAQGSWTERATSPSLAGADEVEVPEPDNIDAPADDPVHTAARLLRRGDAAQIRALLAAGEPDRRLALHLIALLARRDVYQDAVRALRMIANDVEADLVRALVDPQQPFAIRRRLPRVLETLATPSCARGLVTGLEDERFEVRYRSGLALARIAARDPTLRPPPDDVHEVVVRELRRTTRKVWGRRRLLDEDTEDAPLLDREQRERVHRSLEHVFTVMSLAYDAEPLRLSLVAVAGSDAALRGTALEYLDNILPEQVKEALFPMLDVRVETRARRSREAIVEELVNSMQSIDRTALARALRERE